MRAVVVTAVFLLVVLMSMSGSAGDLDEMCKRYPETFCRKDLNEKGWHQFGPNRCVKAFFNSVNLNWMDAKKACQKYPNGDLVSIHNDVDLEYVICAMYRTTPGKDHYWVGLNRNNGKWVWTDGTKFDYSFWAGGQPDNFFGIEHCTEMNYGNWGQWNDENCHSTRPYVCSVNI